MVHIEIPPRSGEGASLEAAYDIPLDIRYEDEHLIVLSKQPGLVCHPARGHYGDTLVNALVAHCGIGNLAQVQGEDRPGIVHRLDRDTSGLMLAEKTDLAAARLDEGYTLIECHLFTGRTHQIRVHMAYTQHPVVGDPLYGRAATAKARNRNVAEQSEMCLDRQFLHSWRLSFEHPITGEELSFVDMPPQDLQAILDGLADRSMGRTTYGRELLG